MALNRYDTHFNFTVIFSLFRFKIEDESSRKIIQSATIIPTGARGKMIQEMLL